jgi:hypothetical protein
MENHNLDLTNRILNRNNFDLKLDTDSDYNLELKLRDKIVAYFNGKNWCVVPLSLFLKYPILYDYYYENNEKKDITVVVCPFTLVACSFEAKLYPTEFTKHGILVLKDIHDNYINLIDFNSTDKTVYKKREVELKVYRNVITQYNDPFFLILNKNFIAKPKLDIIRVNNKNLSKTQIYPLSLVHLLIYKSKNTDNHDDKFTVIIGHNIKKTKVTGFNYQKTFINEYIEEHEQEIFDRSGFIYPILYSAVANLMQHIKIKFVYL